jgi:hypothetical protein
LNIERTFHFIQLHGDAEGLQDVFVDFARRYNFR